MINLIYIVIRIPICLGIEQNKNYISDKLLNLL